MDWQDQGIVLKHRRYGEYDAIITALTEHHGKHFGLVKGGFSSKRRASIEPGQEVKLHWRARLTDQLGRFDVEAKRNLSAAYWDDPQRLQAILSSAALLDVALPERESHRDLFFDLRDLLEHLGDPQWPIIYIRWEARLLAGLGYGLDLSACAVTGQSHHLAYVSPRTGRSVSIEGAGSYKDRLLPLPLFFLEETDQAALAEVRAGLRLTGHFLERHVYIDRKMPNERQRLLEMLQ